MYASIFQSSHFTRGKTLFVPKGYELYHLTISVSLGKGLSSVKLTMRRSLSEDRKRNLASGQNLSSE